MQSNLSSLRLFIRHLIREAVDQNSDGDNDFKDVKIARMKASGMSKKDIKKKNPDLYEDDYEDADEEILGEPDQSSEDQRDAGQNEISTVGSISAPGEPGNIRGYQVPLGWPAKKKKGGCGS